LNYRTFYNFYYFSNILRIALLDRRELFYIKENSNYLIFKYKIIKNSKFIVKKFRTAEVNDILFIESFCLEFNPHLPQIDQEIVKLQNNFGFFFISLFFLHF